jgi:hypothetical protein
MQNGGARPGAGRPKGRKLLKTLEKEQAREYVRQMVTARLESLLEAQLDNAEGIRHLMMRDPKTASLKESVEMQSRSTKR